MFLQKIFTLLVIIGCAGMIAFSTATNSQAQGYSPSYKLLKAVRKKDYNEIRKLVRGGVNINTRDIDEGKTALYLAAETRDTQLIIYLLENKAKPDVPDRKSKETPLMVSARLGDIASVRSFIIAKADLDIQDITGQTALIKALQSRSSRIIELLLKAGADAALEDYLGRTVLRYAKENGRIRKIVKLLEKYGAVE